MLVPIIDRYLLAEVSKAFLAVLLVLVLVVHSHSFISLLDDVASGTLHEGALFQLFGLQVIRYLPRLIPPAFFFAILYAMGRMYQDSEMVALQSCGVGLRRIYRAFIFSAVPLALITAWLSMWVSPWCAAQAERVKEMYKGQAAQLAGVSAGQFNEYSEGDLVFYVESLDKTQNMSNLFVQRRQHGVTELVTAKEGHQVVDEETGDRYIVMNRGHRYEGTPGNSSYSVGTFVSYALRVGRAEDRPVQLGRTAAATSYLLKSKDIYDKAEFQSRLAFPLAVLVFALVSIPLTRSVPRQGVYGKLFFAFVVYFVFMNLQELSRKWMEQGHSPTWLGTWWVDALMVVLTALLLFYEMSRFKAWRRPRSRAAEAAT